MDNAHARRTEKNPLNHAEIDAVWIGAAARLGFRVERSDNAYASFDGAGVITIGSPATLDDDDCVAQLVFHELCHALVQGESQLNALDWGLDNTHDGDRVQEDACLRVQAHLAGRFGLRTIMTPTTVTRPYYDGLGAQALADDRASEADAVAKAQAACTSGLAARFVPVIEDALVASARFVLDRMDCRVCGACCREAFDAVTVAVRDPVTWRHPQLIERHGPRFSLARRDGRCAALDVRAGGWSCAIYDDRPQACREFAKGSAKCFTARRRLGLELGVASLG